MNSADLGDILWEFEGRIGRPQFWIGTAVVWGLAIFYGIVVFVAADLLNDVLVALLALALFLSVWWMGLAVSVKRWHDRGRSAWWVLILGIPIIGFVWATIETGVMAGTPGANRYGRDYWNQYGRKPDTEMNL
jgi:uncharacterized membrane protein YhaH (DUF805 family)